MPNSAIPPLAEELPTAELELELLTVSGGSVVFKTNCAYVINLLGEGLGDMTSGDLLRIRGSTTPRLKCLETRENLMNDLMFYAIMATLFIVLIVGVAIVYSCVNVSGSISRDEEKRDR